MSYDIHPDRLNEALNEAAASTAGLSRADQLELLAQTLRKCLEDPDPLTDRTRAFTLDGAALYAVTPGQFTVLFQLAPPDIRALQDDSPLPWPPSLRPLGAVFASLDRERAAEPLTLRRPAHIHDDDGTVEGCPGCFPGEPPAAGIVWEAPHWPELGEGWDVAEILAAIRMVDQHLDAATSVIYQRNPLANMWRRLTKVMAESGEVWEELSLLTGENPRKGTHPEAAEKLLAELGDVAVAALCGIQSQVKDTDATWAVFMAALAKSLARVPREQPSGYDPDNEETDA